MGGYPVKKWQILSSKEMIDCFIFKVKQNTSKSPLTNREHNFYILDSKNWANIIAITPENKIIMVRQYRHGVDDITLEIPAGIMEINDPTPETTIKRELLEEAGYEAKIVIMLGSVFPNPAFLNNMCTTFVARDVIKTKEQNLDNTENIGIEEVELEKIPELIKGGKILHSLTIAAFYLYEHS